MNDTGMKAQTQELGHTPYSKDLQTEALHTLQDFVSDSSAAPAFLANVQISKI
jgi:tryptophan 2,3-dioxygenase